MSGRGRDNRRKYEGVFDDLAAMMTIMMEITNAKELSQEGKMPKHKSDEDGEEWNFPREEPKEAA